VEEALVSKGYSTPVDIAVDDYSEAGRAAGMTETDPELADVWNVALEALSRDPEVSAQQRAFVALTRPITVVDDMVILAAPNDFTRDILHTRLEPYVRKALGTALHRDVRLAITVDAAQAPGLDEDATDALADSTYAKQESDSASPASAQPSPSDSPWAGPENWRWAVDLDAGEPANQETPKTATG
jgi:hypothetical protein